MATHSALFCQEVLETILENTSPAETDGTSYHKSHYEAEKKGLPVSSRLTLLSAALVCKAFSKPALAALWRYIKDISPLMKLVGGLKGHPCRSYVSLSKPLTAEPSLSTNPSSTSKKKGARRSTNGPESSTMPDMCEELAP